MDDRPYAPLPGRNATYAPPGTRGGQPATVHQVDRAANTAVISFPGDSKRQTVKLEHLRRPPEYQRGDDDE